jgi:acetyltransferase
VPHEDIRRAVLDAIRAIAPETDVDRLSPDRPLREQIDLDSMDWLNVMIGLHHQLAVDVPESEYDRLATLDEIVAFVAAGRTRQADEAAPRPAPATSATASDLPCTRHWIKGTAVELRPIRPDDLPLEADFVRHLSPESRYQRFMLTVSELPQAKLHRLTEVDQVRHVALVATVEHDGRPLQVGVVRYIVGDDGASCEFAIALDDGWHGTGLAGLLMHALMQVARARGLKTMEGIVLASNTAMLKLARQLGFSVQRDPEDRDTVRVVRPL